jgi:hypothetical protein
VIGCGEGIGNAAATAEGLRYMSCHKEVTNKRISARTVTELSLPSAVGNSRERNGTPSTIYNADLGRLEAWVVKNSSWLALGIIAVGFAMRLAYSESCYLNPDEAAHLNAPRSSSWLEA